MSVVGLKPRGSVAGVQERAWWLLVFLAAGDKKDQRVLSWWLVRACVVNERLWSCAKVPFCW